MNEYFATLGGGGVYRWSAASTATPNAATVVQLTAGGTGRFLLIPNFDGSVSVKSYGAKGDNNNDQAALTTAVNEWRAGVYVTGDLFATPGYELVFPTGTYNAATFPSFITNDPGCRIRGDGRPVLKHTGSGVPIDLFQTNPAINGYGPHFENLRILGNSNSTSLVRIKNHNRMCWSNIDLMDCSPSQFAMYIEFSILSQFYHLTCGKGFTTGCVPVGGILLGAGTASDTSVVSCNFYGTVMEGVGTGIQLDNAFNCGFYGGTSEGNTRGVHIAAPSDGNTFDRIFCELNTSSDFVILGNQTTLNQCYGSSTNSVFITGRQTRVIGGYFNGWNSSGGSHTVIDGAVIIGAFSTNATDKWRGIFNGTSYIADNW
jgi:hypothetical protein